jgi:hypothetical protein
MRPGSELGERTADLPPLGFLQSGDLGVREIGKGDAEIGLHRALGAGQRTNGGEEGGAEVGHRVDREQAR